VGCARVAVTALLSSQQAAGGIADVVEVADDVGEEYVCRRSCQAEAAMGPPGGLEQAGPSQDVQDLREVVPGYAEGLGDVVYADRGVFLCFRQVHDGLEGVDSGLG
jgi:hypothetical protein